ncbi:MAG: serine hydrolase family protein, partial [Polyangiaceae bacterium]|nr:serine hydrolase family protein [Polyangiaceae bacterium]
MRLILLHGFLMNGAAIRRQWGRIARELEQEVQVLAPDAPLTPPAEVVQRSYASWGVKPIAGPHRAWWRATEDESSYEGWERSHEQLMALVNQGPYAIAGFSQGAAAAALVCAWARLGQMRTPEFAVFVGGFVPRAVAFSKLFEEPLGISSIHVSGAADIIV